MQSRHLSTSCCHPARFNCPPFSRRLIQPAVAQSFPTTSRVPVATSLFQDLQLQSDAQTTPVSSGVWTTAAPPNRQSRKRTATQTETLTNGTSAVTLFARLPRHLNSWMHRNLRLAAASFGTVRSPCGIDNATILLAWTHKSPERHQPTFPQVERTRCARSLTACPRCGPSRVKCEVVHLGLPEEIGELSSSWLGRVGGDFH